MDFNIKVVKQWKFQKTLSGFHIKTYFYGNITETVLKYEKINVFKYTF